MTSARFRSCLWAAPALLVALAGASWAQQDSAGADADLGPPYRDWLLKDVQFIIEAEECRAFLGLGTDEERDRFIDSFWARRDPAPDTETNEFRTEHYRRIDYASDRFRAARPGWSTDRGRVYIRLGPPDEIEAHPSGGQYRPADGNAGFSASDPFQIWRYRRPDRPSGDTYLVFVDDAGDGEYAFRPGAPSSERPELGPGCP